MTVRDNSLQSREAGVQFDPIARSSEGQFSHRSAPVNNDYESRASSLTRREEQGNTPRHTYIPSPTPPAPKKRRFVTNLKKRGGALAMVLLVGGGAGTVGFITTVPSIGLGQILETFDKAFDFQTTASSKIIGRLTKAQLKDSNVDCKGAKACESLTSVSDREAKTFKEAGVNIERDPTTGRIIKMDYADPSTGDKFNITNSTELDQAMGRSANFEAAVTDDARNAKFITEDDTTARRVLAKNGASKAPIDGEDEKSLKKAFDDSIDGKKPSSVGKSLKANTDKDGNVTSYTDEDGNIHSPAEVEADKAYQSKIDAAGKIGSGTMASEMTKGVTNSLNALGVATRICSLKSTVNAVQYAGDALRAAQEIRVMATAASIVGEWKASNSGIDRDTSMMDKKMEMLGNIVTSVIDNNEQMADPNSPAGSGKKIKNPNYQKTGFDSDVYAVVAHGFTGQFGARTQRFLPGSPLKGPLKNVGSLLDDVSPKMCKVVQNPLIQGGGLLLGIATGAVTLGTTTYLTTAGSLAFSFAEPYMISILADLTTGGLTKGLIGTDFVDVWGIGTHQYKSQVARAGGLMPLSKNQAIKYLTETNTIQAKYARIESKKAEKTPFDVTNQYSFLGSLTRSILPYTQTSSKTLGMIALNVSGIFSAASSTLMNTAHAADYVSDDRFNQCKIDAYTKAGIDLDMTCLPIYGLSPEAMQIDPIENSIWMRDTGNVDPSSGTGEPRDNKQPWNYQKFTEKCLQNSAPDELENQLVDCSVVPGAKNKALNDRFSVFKESTRLKSALSAEPLNKMASNNGSMTNKMSSDGWVFPTTLDAELSSGYGVRTGNDGNQETHEGIDLAQPNNTAMDKPIYAARAGKVVSAGPASGFGNWIVIDHGNGLYTVYGHMKSKEQGGITVSVGDEVKAGQPIGKIGSEGNSSGPHLHFAEWKGGDIAKLQGGFVDPTAEIMKARDEARV